MSGGQPARICVLGSINIDLVVRAPKLPAPGETVIGGKFSTFPGGKGANQAVAAGRLGASVSLIGCVGSDDHGRMLTSVLQKESVELSNLIPKDQTPTGVGLITVAEGGENTIVVAPGANAAMTVEDVRKAESAIRAAQILLVQFETPAAAIAEGIRIAREAGVAVAINAAPAPLAGSASRDLVRQARVLVVNKNEGAVLAGVEPTLDPARVMLRLAEFGPPTVVMTLGAQGAIFVHRGRPKRVATIPVDAVDSVGAGDAFCAALAVGFADVLAAPERSEDEFRRVEAAVHRACVTGALAATKRGAIPSLPTLAEVDAAMPQLAGSQS
jgi:ribokinase